MNEMGFIFDLQLFADGAEGGAPPEGAEASTEGGAPPEGKGGIGADNNTILGGKPPEGGDSGQDAAVPETYDFKGVVPEGMDYDQAAAEAFSTVARSCGLTQDQAAKVAAYGMNYMQAGVASFENQVTATIQGWGEEAKKELGADFAATTQKAAIGIEAMEKTIPNLRAALNETGAGNRIEIIRALAMVGELFGEDKNRLSGAAATAAKNIYPNTDFSAYVN